MDLMLRWLSRITNNNHVCPAKAGHPYVDHRRADFHPLRQPQTLHSQKRMQTARQGCLHKLGRVGGRTHRNLYYPLIVEGEVQNILCMDSLHTQGKR